MLDLMLLKAQQEYQETMNGWKQVPHIMKWFAEEEVSSINAFDVGWPNTGRLLLHLKLRLIDYKLFDTRSCLLTPKLLFARTSTLSFGPLLTLTGTGTTGGLLGQVLRLSRRGTWTRWYWYLSAWCATCALLSRFFQISTINSFDSPLATVIALFVTSFSLTHTRNRGRMV